MALLTFAPGPSKVYNQLPDYFQEACREGILSASHRSAVFMDLYKDTETLFKDKLGLPDDYKLMFTSSSTENWEIVSQSLVMKASYHIYSGSFGKKWYNFANHIIPETAALVLDKNQQIPLNDLEISDAFDFIAVTQNETSNATQVTNETIAALGEKYPDKMLAIDSTSSMAGIFLDFKLADVWYASVQKCFGLPAGLGLLLLSPKAIEKAEQKGENGRYNSLNFMLENAKKYQTHYTPNVLGIYLLNRVLSATQEIHETHKKTEARMKTLESIVENSSVLEFLVSNSATRSRTVLGVGGEQHFIKRIKSDAEARGMQLGNGYGPLKPTSFRIANFPALEDEEFEQLVSFLKAY